MIKPQIIRWSGLHYGWVVLLIAMICQIFTAPGQTVGVSEFKDLYAHQLQASPRTVAIYYCYGTALGSFALPLFGFLIDRIGCRSSLIVISSLLAITCFLSGWVTNVWGMLLAFTFLRMLAQGALSLVASTMVALWFKRKLAIAYSVMSVGSGFGMMFVPYVFKPLFQTFELAVGFQIIALGICLLIPLAIFLVVDRPSLIGLSQDGDPIPRENQEPSANEKSHWINPDDFTFWEAISTRSFWIVTASQSAWALIGTGLVFNRKSIFTSLDASEFLTDLAIPGLFGAVIVGQILTAIVARRCLHSTLFTVGSSGMTIACALILFQTAESAFTGFVVFGFSQGIYIIIGQSLWADFYGRAHIGKIKGLVWGIVVLASSVGGFALTLGETPQTQFQPIKQAMVAMAIFTVACTFIQKPTLPHRPRADHPDSPPS